MSDVTIQKCTRSGLAVDLTTAAAVGDAWTNTGKEMLIIKNTDASPHDVKVTVQAQPDSKDVTERTVTVAAGAIELLGAYPTNVYNDSGGKAQITYSAVTGMKVAVVNFLYT